MLHVPTNRAKIIVGGKRRMIISAGTSHGSSWLVPLDEFVGWARQETLPPFVGTKNLDFDTVVHFVVI